MQPFQSFTIVRSNIENVPNAEGHLSNWQILPITAVINQGKYEKHSVDSNAYVMIVQFKIVYKRDYIHLHLKFS